MNAAALKAAIESGALDQTFLELYGADRAAAQRVRYCEAVDEFVALYGDRDHLRIFSAPGRTEISGNHTDHNHGRVLAASVNLDIIAIAAASDSGVITVKSKGYRMDKVDIFDLDVKKSEFNKAISVIRGTAARFTQQKHRIGGLDAYTTSDVLKGSGLSSSAAFEVLIGTMLNHLYNDGAVSPVAIAQYAQYAENVYFDKPSGLMDQMASSVGNIITIDFGDAENPVIEKVDFDFNALGCALCIVDTGGNHADLTHEYASIPQEMKAVAGYFGHEVLRPVSYEDLLDNAPVLREKFGDRALLRAMHFVQENKRVARIVAALQEKDYSTFERLLVESGRSSFCYLQNVYANIAPQEQGLSLALAAAENLLGGEGAFRVHGGGFGGTTQNFVPLSMVTVFKATMESLFGAGSCHILSIRPVGGTEIKLA